MSAVAPARPRASVVWFRDTERWDVPFFQQFNWRWRDDVIRPVGDAIVRRRAEVDSKIDRAELPIIEKISFGGNISVTAPDDRVGYKGRLFWAEAGNLIYSKIRAKQGSLAIVPTEVQKLAVSAEYPVYEINRKVADPAYLALVFRSTPFMRLLEGLSHGGSTKTRIPPEEFERQRIPLPPLPVQRKIVAAWEAARKYAANAAAKIERLEREIEARFLADLGLKAPQRTELPKAFALPWSELERWSVTFNQLASVAIDITDGKYPVANLGDVAAVSYGIQKCPANRPGQHPRPYLRVANVQRGELDLREIKYIDVPDKELANLRLEPGDILVVEGNGSKAELGRCALWRGQIGDCVHQNHILKVRTASSMLLPEFAMSWFNTDAGKDHFFRSAKTSSGLGTINSSELRAAPIPIPPLSIQRKMVDRVTMSRAEIARLKGDAKTRADAAKADVEAMILGTKPVT